MYQENLILDTAEWAARENRSEYVNFDQTLAEQLQAQLTSLVAKWTMSKLQAIKAATERNVCEDTFEKRYKETTHAVKDAVAEAIKEVSYFHMAQVVERLGLGMISLTENIPTDDLNSYPYLMELALGPQRMYSVPSLPAADEEGLLDPKTRRLCGRLPDLRRGAALGGSADYVRQRPTLRGLYRQSA